ncbi:hypothetical protein CYLTODRAFT_494174 [Cylindrobasidium torrendii FP15055 ss-10]|uniref:F-box domain-containing protein n=1 Tax=Cylindrobasidium torrendii FP15055 ss-10 TaxID=1314674 RepID=A0A0D7B0N6_9AGAR|nr:hypothetical protein CYLTODRAFT_494174 [Cylindrobasidium torrendii FP15055 ss-10]
MERTGIRGDRGGDGYFLPLAQYWRSFDTGGPLDVDHQIGECAHPFLEILGNRHVKREHKRVVMRLTPFPLLKTLPNELLLDIFGYLDTHDLSRVSRTCWAFYNLSIKGMLRNLRWYPDGGSTNQSLIWKDRSPELDRLPSSLHIHGARTLSFESMLDRYRSFTSLKNLQLSGFDLSQSGEQLYSSFFEFPNLRRLSFMKCTLPPCPQEYAERFADLPLEELDMLFTSWEPSTNQGAHAPHLQHHHFHILQLGGHPPVPTAGPLGLPLAQWNILPLPMVNTHYQTMQSLQNLQNTFPNTPIPPPPPPPPPNNVINTNNIARRFGALNLTSAKGLRVLRLDWTDAVAMFLVDEGMMINPPSTANLHTLELRGLDESKTVGGSVHEYLMHTVRLLRGCTKLERLGMMPDVRLKRLPLEPGLNTLHTFRAPLETLKVFHISHSVRNIVGVNEISPLRLAYCLPASLPALQSIELRLSSWDVEVLHCAKQVFPTVRDFRVKYFGSAGPDAQTLMAFPYEFLPALPNLQILHMYSVGRGMDKLRDDNFAIMRIGKKLANLMEVRLQSHAVWRRSTVQDDDWCLRDEIGESVGWGGELVP